MYVCVYVCARVCVCVCVYVCVYVTSTYILSVSISCVGEPRRGLQGG
jgi:hypothetical protein